MGSWVTYGLGSENQNLPGFVSMCPGGMPIKRAENWRSAFLPGAFQGTYIDSSASTDVDKLIENIRNPSAARCRAARGSSTSSRKLNERHAGGARHDPQLEARIQQLRARLPHADRGHRRLRRLARSRSTSATMYGPGDFRPGRCLIARRLSSAACGSSSSGTARASRGTATTTSRNHRRLAGRVRPADRRAAHRPEAARAARRHAGHLGRRVRPHAGRRAADSRAPTPAR